MKEEFLNSLVAYVESDVRLPSTNKSVGLLAAVLKLRVVKAKIYFRKKEV